MLDWDAYGCFVSHHHRSWKILENFDEVVKLDHQINKYNNGDLSSLFRVYFPASYVSMPEIRGKADGF